MLGDHRIYFEDLNKRPWQKDVQLTLPFPRNSCIQIAQNFLQCAGDRTPPKHCEKLHISAVSCIRRWRWQRRNSVRTCTTTSRHEVTGRLQPPGHGEEGDGHESQQLRCICALSLLLHDVAEAESTLYAVNSLLDNAVRSCTGQYAQ